MNVTKRKMVVIILVIGIVIPLSNIINPTSTRKIQSKLETKENYNLNTAGFWNLTGTPIFINGTATGVDAHNWSWVEDQIWFGGGNGNWDNPYLIGNITIDGLGMGNCIEIINSDKYFIIKNCTVFNSGSQWNDAGISFTNISNGQITNCTTNFNEHGFMLVNSSNCVIQDSYFIDNDFTGIYPGFYSYNNKITNNTFIEDTKYPDAFIYSDFHLYRTEISDNTFISSTGRSEAIKFYGTTIYYINISNNIIKDCHRGIDLTGIGHIVAYNELRYNLSKIIPSRVGITIGCIDSFIFNNTIDYYMNGIMVEGYGNDIIGNTVRFGVERPGPTLLSGNGIYLYYATDNIVGGNDLQFNEISGICVHYSTDNIIIGNKLIGNKDCIIEFNSSDNFYTNNICDENETHYLQVDFLEQSYSSQNFNITFLIKDENNQSIASALLKLWWDGFDVSSDVQNLGEGLYFISLDSIPIFQGEDPILLNMSISALGYNDTYFETYIAVEIPEDVKYLQIEINEHVYSLEHFNFTFFVYDEMGQGIDFAIFQLLWDNKDLSADIQNLGSGYYFISLEPITVAIGEDPILLSMSISASGYEDKYFETYIAIDPDTLQKGAEKPSEEFPLLLIITISVISAGVIAGAVGIYLLKRRSRKAI